MKNEFWQERWRNNQTGFHQDDYSPYLVNHWHSLNISNNERVFVPLAGKTKDILWLRDQQLSVFAIELSELAVDAFFSENNLSAITSADTNGIQYKADQLEFLCGDFFKLTAHDLSEVAAAYDRASLIAMPIDMRLKYAKKMTEILSPGCKILLVTMEYPQAQMDGPPFSVTEIDVKQLYAKNFTIEKLKSYDILSENERFKKKGLTEMFETVYCLQKK